MPIPRPAQLDSERARHRPPGHKPNAPAWTTVLGEDSDTVVYAQLGVQDRAAASSSEGAELRGALHATLTGPHAPTVVDFAAQIDDLEHQTELAIAYWSSPGEAQSWRSRVDVTEFWSRPPEGDVGLWREVLTIPAGRFETLHSTNRGGQGVSNFARIEPTVVHEYDGAARDRIAVSRHEDLAPHQLDLVAPGETRNKVLKPRAHDGVCFIRTAQDWSRCRDHERALYIDHVAPALREGTRFLREHPAQTGCLSGRFVRELAGDGVELDRTCFLGFFVSLGHLEQWTWSHATHAAIFGSFMELVASQGGDIALSLWHEVCVLPGDAIELEYRNCDPSTGLLPHSTWVSTS